MALVFSALLGTLAACAAGQQAAAPDELAGVRDGKTTAVLLRFVLTNQDGKAVKPFEGAIPNLLLSIGDFETGGEPTKEVIPGFELKPRSVRPYPGRLLSKASAADGWMTLFLPPGYYYLGLGDPYVSWVPDKTKMFIPGSPEWRIAVPPGVPVLYAGTFHVSVRTSLGSVYNQLATWVDDQSSLAADVARGDLASLAPPVTRVAARQAGPRLLGVPTVAGN